MDLIWIFMVVFFFSCHDSHKHLHEMSGIGLWICCLMGEITKCLWTHGCISLPHLWRSKPFILCVLVSKTERYAALPYVLIAACRSVGLPTGGVCINAVICKWHALETSVLSGRTASDVDCLYTQIQMQIIKIFCWCVAAFSCTVAETAAQKRCRHSVYCSLGRYRRLIWPEGNVCSLDGQFCPIKCPRSVTNLNHFTTSTFCHNCHPLSPSISAAQRGVSVCLEIKFRCVMMFAVILALCLWCVAVYHMGRWIGEQFSSPGSWESLQRKGN